MTNYVHDRIIALRRQQAASEIKSPTYQNISVIRANTMKFLPNFFPRSSLRHIFLCFPDPHFKARKHKARIVSDTLCAEYAYVLQNGGCVWTITDVQELAEWIARSFRESGSPGGNNQSDRLFERLEVPNDDEEDHWVDQQLARIVKCMRLETEEGQKVSRNKGTKYVSVWRRRADPPWPET